MLIQWKHYIGGYYIIGTAALDDCNIKLISNVSHPGVNLLLLQVVLFHIYVASMVHSRKLVKIAGVSS